jgi:hypothetical protein
MANDVRINWHAQDVLLAADKAQREWLLRLAFQVEGEFKVRAAVDTGFMYNATYVNGAGESNFIAQEKTLRSEKTGQMGVHRTAPSPEQPQDDSEVIMGVAADYAIYSEIRTNALYEALQAVAAQAPATITAVGRKHFD